MDAISSSIVGPLLRASLQGAVLIAAVWLVCRLIPRLPASLRCGLWWLACLKLVTGLLWAEPVRLAWLPAEPVPAAAPLSFSSPEVADPKAGEGLAPSRAGGEFEPLQSRAEFPWQSAALAAWGLGVLCLLGLTAWQQRQARRLVRRAEPIKEPWLADLFSALRERTGAPRRTAVRLSAEVKTPQVTGLLHPVILLPESAPCRLSRPEMAMTLCHELLHVRRGDLWLGWVPALAQRLFFFHPLAFLAVREYALAREAACDADVLRVLDPAPETYGRLLVRLGVTPQLGRLAAAGAAPSFQILKRRLQMLQNASPKKRLHPGWWGLAALVAAVALVPFTITAQEAPPAPIPPAPPAETAEVPPPPPPPPAVPAPPAPPIRIAEQSGHRIPPVPPVAPVAPVPPVPPVPPRGGHGYHYSYNVSDGDSYILLLAGKNTIMNGSTSDIAKVKKLRKNDNEELFWFEHGGKEYVIRAAATLKQVKALFEPQQKLGEQQGALGEQQAKLGSQQAALGSKQAEQGAKLGELGAQMGKLGAELGRLSAAGKSTDAIEAQMHELEQQMKKHETPQEDLGRQQEALGRQQEALGRQQEELGRKQEEAAREAEKQLKVLSEKTIASGLAQEVK